MNWGLIPGNTINHVMITSSLSERCSLAPCGRLVSGKITQEETKDGHEALCYRFSDRLLVTCFNTFCVLDLEFIPGEVWRAPHCGPAENFRSLESVEGEERTGGGGERRDRHG